MIYKLLSYKEKDEKYQIKIKNKCFTKLNYFLYYTRWKVSYTQS